MDLGLTGAVMLVTGATGGIGSATAETFLHEGATVMMSARSPEADAQAFQVLHEKFGDRCAYVAVDLEDVDGPAGAVRATVATFGRIDGIVVSGVPTPMGGVDDTSELELLTRLEGKAVACARMAKAAVPTMRTQRSGVLIFIAGVSAHTATGHAYLSGTMATSAIHGLTKSLADELAIDGIRVVAVDPGFTDTRRFREQALPRMVADQGVDAELIVDKLRLSIPLGQIADPSDIADGIVFLSSRRARHITGTHLLIDGGTSRAVR